VIDSRVHPHGGLIAVGGVLGLLGVAAGAFGAHALEGAVTPERLAVFDTAARYHLVHALAIVLAGAMAMWLPLTRVAGWLFTLGIVVFAGSLYLLVLLDAGWLGAITPIGGLAFMAGWGVLAWAGFRSDRAADRPSGGTVGVPGR
jgi:uncharacterized membrane protein YgdD (TMEM256/DUF423 family)